MFIGHFGVGFAGKAVAPTVSLGTLFFAAQFLDLLWPTLLLLGLESVRIVPGITAVTPLAFDRYPISHSLAAVCVWALLLAAAHWMLRRNRRAAFMLGVLVVSHWLLDAIVHRPDLPLIPGGTTLIGWNAWSSLPLTLAIELPLFLIGVALYMRATRPIDRRGNWGCWGLIVLLLVIYVGNLAGEAPPSAMAIAWVGQAQWLLVILGYWVDKHRSTTPGSRADGR